MDLSAARIQARDHVLYALSIEFGHFEPLWRRNPSFWRDTRELGRKPAAGFQEVSRGFQGGAGFLELETWRSMVPFGNLMDQWPVPWKPRGARRASLSWKPDELRSSPPSPMPPQAISNCWG